MGTLHKYTEALCFGSQADFIAYITGKRVLDIGSGLGGLAKVCELRGIDSKIISVNPKLADSSVRRREKASTMSLKSERSGIIQRAHDRSAVAA